MSQQLPFDAFPLEAHTLEHPLRGRVPDPNDGLDEQRVLLCLSGRGDKDLAEVLAH